MVKLIAGGTVMAFAIVVMTIGINEANGSTQPGGVTWTKETQRKNDVLISLGMPKEVSTALINECKVQAKDPAHCIKIGASILGAESSLGTRCSKDFNCFGMEDGRTKYKSKADGVRDWVRRYSKHWYKQKNPDGFYSNTPKRLPATRYCMGGALGYCSNGWKNSWKTFNALSSFK